MHRGWIKLYRRINDNWIWEEKPFSKGQAWIDLLLLANYEERKATFKGEVITCEIGTVNISVLELSRRWGWSRGKTRQFLTLLEKDNMIELNCTTNRTTICIVNYRLYSDLQPTDYTTKSQRDDSEMTAKSQRDDITKNIKNINNINNNSNTNNIIDLSNKGSKKKSEACDAIKMMRQEYEQRVKPQYSVWEEHQCSGTLDRLREQYDGVFDEKYVWMADQP